MVTEVILGFLTFTGSLMATGKLQGVSWIPQRPVIYPYQNFINMGLFAIAVLRAALLVIFPSAAWAVSFHLMSCWR